MSDHANETFGQRLRRLRQAAGLDIDQLAGEIGIDASVCEAWERDETKPHASTLVDISETLNCSVHALFEQRPLEPPTAALLQFLETPLGKRAERHGLAPILQTLRPERPPTVALYNAITTVLLEGAERADS